MNYKQDENKSIVCAIDQLAIGVLNGENIEQVNTHLTITEFHFKYYYLLSTQAQCIFCRYS